MKTIYFAATSLDGFIADKNNSLDWLFQLGEPEGNFIQEFVDSVGAIAMGSTTYEWIYEHQILKDGKVQGTWPYKVPCFVFTTRQLPIISNADIRFVQGDVRPIHVKMTDLAQGKNIWIMGGGELAGKFYDAQLLGELQLQVASVTLGGGAPLFPRYLKTPLKLQSVKQRGTGAVELIYTI